MEIIILIAKIILLILEGVQSTDAVSQISDEYGVSFSELWSNLPDMYK